MNWTSIFWLILGICLILYGIAVIPAIGFDPVHTWALIAGGTISAGILCCFRAKGS